MPIRRSRKRSRCGGIGAARFSKYLADLQQSDLTQTREVLENGTAPIQGCLHTVFEEELGHLGYATRDLDLLETD